MVEVRVTWVLAALALLVIVSTIPYLLTAIRFRRRDNGLAFILLILGLATWNGMFVGQLLTTDPLVSMFYLGQSVVGAVLTGLGWFLFATTASGTSNVLSRTDVYVAVALLGGLDIAVAVMAPLHTLYWQLDPTSAGSVAFAAVLPSVGYWLHTLLLVVLFGAGTVLFADAWLTGTYVRYSRAYTVLGAVTVVAILGSNVLAPGGLGVGSLAAAGLTTTGWLQASRGQVLTRLRGALG